MWNFFFFGNPQIYQTTSEGIRVTSNVYARKQNNATNIRKCEIFLCGGWHWLIDILYHIYLLEVDRHENVKMLIFMETLIKRHLIKKYFVFFFFLKKRN